MISATLEWFVKFNTYKERRHNPLYATVPPFVKPFLTLAAGNMSPFAQALFYIAQEEGNTQSIEALRNKALESMAAGYAKAVISSSVNSKAFSFNVSKPADVLFAESSWAIQRFNNGIITSTTLDFTLLY